MSSRSLLALMASLEARDARIAVIGLGYVGLPLAVEFSKRYRVIGYDIKKARIDALRQGSDVTREVEAEELRAVSNNLELTSEADDMASAAVYIVTVPTPIDIYKRPDLGPLLAASRTVGGFLETGNVVIYESTVYPGCTEEDCIPILEAESGLSVRVDTADLGHREPESKAEDSNTRSGPPDEATHSGVAGGGHFFVGYSPERMNPGDKQHSVTSIVKVTSGSTAEAAVFVDELYASIIAAGTHRAPSIKVAEAAKVIENTQRDVNIALVNELSMLFNRLGIDTMDVLQAAGTKWNFLPFRPGLVGGHCIGVDPYYLTYKAQQLGFHPQMILAGRRINDGMGQFVAGELVKLMAQRKVYRPGARVLLLGLTFKENCPDLRNTRVVDVVDALRVFGLEVDVHDPLADPGEALQEYDIELVEYPEHGAYSAAILCVAHAFYGSESGANVRQWLDAKGVLFDLKGALPDEIADKRL